MKKSLILILVITSFLATSVEGQKRRRGSTARRPTTTGVGARVKRKSVPVRPPSPSTTMDSGLTYVITRRGDGKKLKAGDTVIIHYTGLLTNGVKFDSSHDRGAPFTFPLGAGRVIKGWDEGVAQLSVGDHATLVIPSQLGYGARGAGSEIPPGATLIFVVEVVGVQESSSPVNP